MNKYSHFLSVMMALLPLQFKILRLLYQRSQKKANGTFIIARQSPHTTHIPLCTEGECRMSRLIPVLLFSCFILFLSSCAAQQPSEGPDYKEIKSMVVDILKTEEGKKAIEEAQKDSEQSSSQIMQMLSSPEGQQIQMAVKEVLTDPQYEEQLKKLMTDPKFAGDFAKAVQKENEQIHKKLMTDPEYQALLLDVMKNDDFKKMIMEVLKSKEYRQQTMTIMQEAIENPLFRVELMELMKKVMEEESKPKEEKKEEQGGGSGDSGGGGGS